MMSFTEVTDGQGVLLSSTASTTNNLHATGPNALGVDSQTFPGDSSYLIVPSDRTVATSVTLSGTWTWTLPLAGSVARGWEIVVSDHAGVCNLTTSIVINMSGADTINGSAAYARVVKSPYGFFRFRSDGSSNWQIVGQFPMAGTPVGDTNYQILSTDTYVYTTAPLTVSRTWALPAAASVASGWLISIADSAGGITDGTTQRINVQRFGNNSDTFNGGGSSPNINARFGYLTVQSDGVSNWQIVGGSLSNDILQTAGFDDLFTQGACILRQWGVSVNSGRFDNVQPPSATPTHTPSYVAFDSASGAFSLSGIAVPSVPSLSGRNQLLLLWNNTSYAMTLLNENANSTAANRFLSPTGADVVVGAGGSAQLIYSGASRWLIQNAYDGTVVPSGGVSSTLTSAHLLIGNGSNVATDTAVTGDVTITNAGVTAIGSSKVTSAMIVDGTIVNADIANGTIDLTAKVTGVLPVANGGSGSAADDGWILDANTWIYGSATSFGIAGATPTTYLPKGTKVSYNDGSVDYGHVASTATASTSTGVATTVATGVFAKTGHTFANGDAVTLSNFTNTTGVTAGLVYYIITVIGGVSFQISTTVGGSAVTLGGTADTNVTVTGATLVTLITNADYSIANHALTAPRYSYADNPQGFPSWYNWSPTLAGWSSNPTNGIYRYRCDGNAIMINIRQLTAGTSNATSHTATLPVAATTITSQTWLNYCLSVDAGTNQAGALRINAAATTVQLDGIAASSNNTNGAGNSRIIAGQLTYEF